MNVATPILLCHRNEELKSLLREMLIKNGFFHLDEATHREDLLQKLPRTKNTHFIIIEGALIDGSLVPHLQSKKELLILIRPEDAKIEFLTTQFPIKTFLSFPFSSRKLLNKIQQNLKD